MQLETVATESFNETSSSFPDKTMRLQLDLQVPEIVGDRRLIREIFRRLFHNAFKFGNANSPIKLESKPVASMIYI
ncbi:MAG: hypothetical protein N2578_05310, partial [Bdellovibrionaceae bacterium]|nr:hypothetical protein [Pseudobdellovibrionaceae bacterium]